MFDDENGPRGGTGRTSNPHRPGPDRVSGYGWHREDRRIRGGPGHLRHGDGELTVTGQFLGTSTHWPPTVPSGAWSGPPRTSGSLGCLLWLPAKNPGHRPTAERVAGWFTAWQDRRPAVPSPAPPGTAAPTAPPATSPASRTRRRRRPAGWRTAVLLGVGAVVLFGSSVLPGTPLGNEARGPSESTTPSPSRSSRLPPRPRTTPRPWPLARAGRRYRVDRPAVGA